MEPQQIQPELFDGLGPPSGTRVINDRCVLRTAEGHRVVVVSSRVVASYAVGDRAGEASAMIALVEQSWASQVEVARAFEASTRTVRRYQRRYDAGGVTALARAVGRPSGQTRVSASRQRTVERLKAAGASNREVARCLGLSEKAVRNQLRRVGWSETAGQQLGLPLDTPSTGARQPEIGGEAPAPPGADGGADASVSTARATAPGSAAERAKERPPARAMAASEGADPNLSAFAATTSVHVAHDASAPDPRASIGRPMSADRNVSASAVTERPKDAPAPAPAAAPASAAPRDIELPPFSADTDPGDRRVDRLLAYLGELDDAVPWFRPAPRVPRAGVLLALPALCASGVFTVAREVYGSIGPAFYGLRTSILALLLMALLRIKRPEGLKELSPIELGQVLGLDRAPEVKTLRRKLARLAALGRATEFGRALAKRRVADRGAALGFLYVDGHVRVYHGKRRLPKTHVTQLRTALPATTDYWVNDVAGDPLLVLTVQANAGLVQSLPAILREIRALVGERRVTIVFDRGGFSPKLFRQMIDDGFDVLTYRKGRFAEVAEERFVRHTMTVDGHKLVYRLADLPVELLGGKLTLRQITRRADDGHQTAILTSREDRPAIELAYRMFERWKQENFFKYLKQEYALDALVDYAVEPDDPERSVPNPARRAIDAELRQAKLALAKLQSVYGAAALANPERRRRTMRGFKIAHGKLGKELRAAMRQVAALEARRATVPERVPVGQTATTPVVRLSLERKLLTNLIKMVAYQAESELVGLLAPHYARADDEGRTLIQNALADDADIDLTADELRIRLAPLSSPHRTRALAAVCEALNRTATLFPGTRLRLRYSVAGPSG